MSTPAFIASVTGYGASGSVSIVIPSATVVNDNMILVVTYKELFAAHSVNTPSGWTLGSKQDLSGASACVYTYYRTASGTDHGTTLTVSATGTQQLVAELTVYEPATLTTFNLADGGASSGTINIANSGGAAIDRVLSIAGGRGAAGGPITCSAPGGGASSNIIIGIHVGPDNYTTNTDVNTSDLKASRVFVNNVQPTSTTSSQLVTLLTNACANSLSAGLKPVVSLKFNVDDMISGACDTALIGGYNYLDSIGAWLLLWHEPENDMTAAKFTAMFNHCYALKQAHSPNLQLGPDYMGYAWRSTAAMPSATAQSWLAPITAADFIGIDTYTNDADADVNLGNANKFQVWYNYVNQFYTPVKKICCFERGISKNDGQQANIIQADIDYLVSIGAAMYLYWDSGGATDGVSDYTLSSAGKTALWNNATTYLGGGTTSNDTIRAQITATSASPAQDVFAVTSGGTGPGARSITVSPAAWYASTQFILSGTGTVGGALAMVPVTTRTTTVNTAIATMTVTATGGTPAYTFTQTGLPTGLSMTTAGVITGTPTVIGVYSVQITVTDSVSATANTTFTWNVVADVTFSNPGSQSGVVGEPLSVTLTASGGTLAYTWSATGLPAGLAINSSTGVIFGTPLTAHVYSTTVTVTDARMVAKSQTFSFTIAATGLPTMVVTYQAGGSYDPSFLVTLTNIINLRPGISTVSVLRVIGTSGLSSVVRGLDHVSRFTGDSISANDYEFPYTKGTFHYQLIAYDVAGNILDSSLVSANQTPDTARNQLLTASPYSTAILQSIQQPALNLPVVVNDFKDWSIAGSVLGTYKVLGRENPIVLTDAMGGRTGTMILLVSPNFLTIYDLDDLDMLITYRDTLLFQPFWAGAGMQDIYLKVTDVSVSRLTIAKTDNSTVPSHLVTVNFTEVDRPDTKGPATAIGTWGDVLNRFSTWQEVLSSRENWLDLLNRPSG